MKNLIWLLFIGLISCDKVSTSTTIYGDYKIVVLDGCEYIEYDRGIGEGRVYSLTHKGNCKNHNK